MDLLPRPLAQGQAQQASTDRAAVSAAAARALRDGGRLRLATDWEDYARQMREVLADAEEFVPAFDGEWAERFDGA